MVNEQLLALRSRMEDGRFKKAPSVIAHRFGQNHGIYTPFFSRWLVTNKMGVDLLDIFSTPQTIDSLLTRLNVIYNNEEAKRAAYEGVNILLKNFFVIDGGITRLDCLERARRRFEDSRRPVNAMYIMFSLRCNFHCSYCYQLSSFKKIDFAMLDFGTIKRAIDHFATHCDSNARPRFLFVGGEPLLFTGLLRQTLQYIQRLHTKLIFGIDEPSYIIISNASLIDDDTAALIKTYGCGIGVSIDGTEIIHNKTRKYPSGSGTFKDVMRGIGRLHKHDIPFTLNLTIGRHNLDRLVGEVRWLGKNVSKEMSFNFMLDPFEFNTKRSPNTEKLLSKLEQVYDMCVTENISEKKLQQRFDRYYNNLPMYQHCNANGGMMVLSPYGKVGPCHHLAAMKGSKYYMPLPNKRANIYHARQWKAWVNRTPLYNRHCSMNCDYVTICGGGCASHALAKGLKLTEFDSFACKLAKFYLRYFLKRQAIDL